VKKKIFGLALTGMLIFGFGFLAGYHIPDDPMCGDPYLAVTTEDLSSDSTYIEKGTLISIRECKNADRFTIEFYMPGYSGEGTYSQYTPRTSEEKEQFTKIGISMAQYAIGVTTEEDKQRVLEKLRAP